MKRRNFIKTSTAGSAFFCTNSLFVFQKDLQASHIKDFKKHYIELIGH